MSTKSTTNTLKFLVIALALLLLSLGIYTFKFYNQVRENEEQLKMEKALILEELNEEMDRYNIVLKEHTAISKQLENAKVEIQALREQLEEQELTRDLVQDYQLELRKLRREREVFFSQNDSLIRETRRLAQLQQETQLALEEATQKQDSILNTNKSLNSKIAKGSQITASNLDVRGVIQRNNGRFTTTIRAKRAEMLQVNYQVDPNAIAPAGDLIFYTQVKDPQGRVIGTPREIATSDGTVLKYNNRRVIPFANVAFTVNELVLGRGNFEKGDYTITVYHNTRELLTGTHTLK